MCEYQSQYHNPLAPPPPKEAFFSGYYTDYEYFQQLSLALNPILAEQVAVMGQEYYMIYVCAYHEWKRELPEDEYDIAPRLKVIHGPEIEDGSDHGGVESKYFFPTRFVGAPEGSEMEEYPQMMLEEREDIVRRDELVDLINRHTGSDFGVDVGRFQFACVRHEHPYYDTRGITYPGETWISWILKKIGDLD